MKSSIVPLVLVSVSAHAQITSDFLTTNESWSAITWDETTKLFTNSASASWTNADGNPPGSVTATDFGSGWFAFQAPSAFQGNLQAFNQTELSFDLKINSMSSFIATYPYSVAIQGTTKTLYYKSFVTPMTYWQKIRVPLVGSRGWRENSDTGPVTTDADFFSQLQNVQKIAIMADYRSTLDTTQMDNVRVGSQLATSTSSSFDASSEGWGRVETSLTEFTTRTGTPAAATYLATQGNPGGAISFTDSTGDLTYFQANQEFTGNLAALYGGTLKWDLRTTGSATVFAGDLYPFAVISGGGQSLINVNPALNAYLPTTFAPFYVPLQPNQYWKFGSHTGPVATPEQFQYVLRHVERVWIRAEYRNGSETNYVDNVVANAALPTVVSGTVDLGPEYVGPKAGIPVTITVWGGPCPLDEVSTVLDADGKYSVTVSSHGQFAVGVKASHWLRKRAESIALNGGTQVVNVSLTNGDCDGNNLVGTDDYLLVNSAFDTLLGDAAFDARADLNGDDYVGTDDYLLLNSSFDLTGD